MAKAANSKTDDLFTAEWFPYYFKRFEGSDRVAVMSLDEEGAYHRAIRLAWQYGTVPSDPKVLAARIGKGCSEAVAGVVLSTFEPVPNDAKRMFHPVLEEIRERQAARSRTNRDRARNAANARWKDGDSDVANEGDSDSPTTPSPAAGATPPLAGGEPQNDAASMHQACLGDAKPMQDRDLNLRSQTLDQKDLKRLMDACVRNFPKLDKRVVEIGVLYTLLQRGNETGPIRSARYFDPEIRKVADASAKLGDKALDALLRKRREQVFGEVKE